MKNLKDMPEAEAIEIFKAWLKDEPIFNGGGEGICPPILTKTSHYSIKKTPDEIDWSHVAPEYKFMVRDKDGDVWVYTDKPYLGDVYWTTPDDDNFTSAAAFTSYNPGTVDWRHSLVERPSFKEGY